MTVVIDNALTRLDKAENPGKNRRNGLLKITKRGRAWVASNRCATGIACMVLRLQQMGKPDADVRRAVMARLALGLAGYTTAEQSPSDRTSYAHAIAYVAKMLNAVATKQVRDDDDLFPHFKEDFEGLVEFMDRHAEKIEAAYMAVRQHPN
jgi:hypothetical protein